MDALSKSAIQVLFFVISNVPYFIGSSDLWDNCLLNIIFSYLWIMVINRARILIDLKNGYKNIQIVAINIKIVVYSIDLFLQNRS